MIELNSRTIFLVCHSLIANGERYEEDTYLGRVRLETLRSLCRMCPDQILMVRSKCVSFSNFFVTLYKHAESNYGNMLKKIIQTCVEN